MLLTGVVSTWEDIVISCRSHISVRTKNKTLKKPNKSVTVFFLKTDLLPSIKNII